MLMAGGNASEGRHPSARGTAWQQVCQEFCIVVGTDSDDDEQQ
jgi:hypothetical protein